MLFCLSYVLCYKAVEISIAVETISSIMVTALARDGRAVTAISSHNIMLPSLLVQSHKQHSCSMAKQACQKRQPELRLGDTAGRKPCASFRLWALVKCALHDIMTSPWLASCTCLETRCYGCLTRLCRMSPSIGTSLMTSYQVVAAHARASACHRACWTGYD